MAVLPTGIGPVTGYQIERSLRFNSADTAYLTRTPASAGNRQKFTISFWMKRSTLGSMDVFTGNAGNGLFLNFRPDDTLYFYDFGAGASGWQIWSARVFRDVGAWYHIMLAVDSTQATDTNRAKIYINGVQETLSTWTVGAGASRYPSLNANFDWNNTNSHEIGYASNYGYFNGYLTEFYNIDGQQLTPSSFGETDSNTGVWKPKAYTGTYGTNGFFLKFADNSNTTAATLGKDSSGNGNNWTPNNFSVTAGAGNDSLVDSPTSYGTDTGVGGEVRSNYCTFNPNLYNAGSVTYSNGNLLMTLTGNADRYNLGTMAVLTGKWYWEVVASGISASSNFAIGICKSSRGANGPWSSYGGPDTIYFNTSDGWSVYGSNIGGGTGTIANGDIIGVALDMDSNYIYLYKNNVLLTSRSGSIDLTISHTLFVNTYVSGSSVTLNAGQRAFAYTAPSGFKALCTQNLPTPTIGATSTTQANDYFNTVLYTGTGSSLGVTGVGFQPDWVWIKERNAAADHGLYDAVRGIQKQLESNTTTAETTETTGLTAFGTDGFTVGALAQLNTSGDTYVAWNWKANGAGSSNTAGTITSTVSANTTSGFSIVTYTGNGTSGATIGHGLGVAPSMVIIKCRSDGASNWPVYHSAIAPNNSVWLSLTNGSTASSSNFNNTATTSTLVTLGNDTNVNGSTRTYVAYCFAPVAGYSAFGSYTGNGAADGPFVFANHRPAFLLVKRTDTTSNWTILDFQREGYNVDNDPLFPNLSDAEGTTDLADLLSNGFKLRSTDASVNASGGTYIYMSLASNPFKFSLAR